MPLDTSLRTGADLSSALFRWPSVTLMSQLDRCCRVESREIWMLEKSASHIFPGLKPNMRLKQSAGLSGNCSFIPSRRAKWVTHEALIWQSELRPIMKSYDQQEEIHLISICYLKRSFHPSLRSRQAPLPVCQSGLGCTSSSTGSSSAVEPLLDQRMETQELVVLLAAKLTSRDCRWKWAQSFGRCVRVQYEVFGFVLLCTIACIFSVSHFYSFY